MASSVNKVILIGNLGKDPEVRNSPEGGKIVTFSIATSETWKDKATGERKDKTEWHRVVVFNEKIGEIAERYLRKGSKVYLEGQLQTRKWTDQQGVERYMTETVIGRFRGELTLLDSKGSNEGSGDYSGDMGSFDTSPLGSSSARATNQASDPFATPSAPQQFDHLNDEVPF